MVPLVWLTSRSVCERCFIKKNMTQDGIWPPVLKLFCASRRPFRLKGLYTSHGDIMQTTSDKNILMINSNQGKNTMCKKRQALILLLFDCTHETFTSWWCQRQIVAFIVVRVQGPGRGKNKTKQYVLSFNHYKASDSMIWNTFQISGLRLSVKPIHWGSTTRCGWSNRANQSQVVMWPSTAKPSSDSD